MEKVTDLLYYLRRRPPRIFHHVTPEDLWSFDTTHLAPPLLLHASVQNNLLSSLKLSTFGDSSQITILPFSIYEEFCYVVVTHKTHTCAVVDGSNCFLFIWCLFCLNGCSFMIEFRYIISQKCDEDAQQREL